MNADGPPSFLLWEVAQVVRATGRELDAHELPIDAGPLVWEEVVVIGAVPTDRQDGWLIQAWVESLDDLCSFPEEALADTGYEEVRGEDGEARRGPLDPGRRWRDDVLIDLRTPRMSDAEATEVARRAAAALAEVDGVSEVDWEVVQGGNPKERWITLWARSDGDALHAFGRIVAQSERDWEHRADESRFVSSLWKRRRKTVFLAPEVHRAAVTYRRYTSPRRRSRDELPLF